MRRGMSMESIDAKVRSLAGTGDVARILANALRPGDVVLLTGDLASGKTTMVKHIAAELGSTHTVTSPTFTLAQFYPCRLGTILHIDTYRLKDIDEFRDLGLDDYFDTCITLIEWGDKVADEFPTHLAVDLRVESDDEGRCITFTAVGPRWTGALATIGSELASVKA